MPRPASLSHFDQPLPSSSRSGPRRTLRAPHGRHRIVDNEPLAIGVDEQAGLDESARLAAREVVAHVAPVTVPFSSAAASTVESASVIASPSSASRSTFGAVRAIVCA